MTARVSPDMRSQLKWLGLALATAAAIAAIFMLARAQAEARQAELPVLARVNIVLLIEDEIARSRDAEGAPDPARLKTASSRIEAAVKTLAAETGYVILADQAVLAGSEQLPDLTDELRARLKGP